MATVLPTSPSGRIEPAGATRLTAEKHDHDFTSPRRHDDVELEISARR
jgi:hypothetical protein